MAKKQNKKYFYGAATVRAKGQIVIPHKARELLGLKTGDQLLVFCAGRDMITLAKLSGIKKLTEHLAKRLEALNNLVKK